MAANAKTTKGVNLEGRVFRKLGETTDEFEVYAHPHAERIATIATEIARRFSLASKDLQSLRAAALLHDFGESIMNRDYIKRPGPLSADERLDLYRHPLIGEQETANSGGDRAAQLIVRWHHEWWNGTGYPDGLAREEIPLACRILRVADSYAAVTDHRPFRRALSKEDAREHMAEWAGIEFDPNVVETLLALEPIPELESFTRSELTFEQPLQPDQDTTIFSSFLR